MSTYRWRCQKSDISEVSKSSVCLYLIDSNNQKIWYAWSCSTLRKKKCSYTSVSRRINVQNPWQQLISRLNEYFIDKLLLKLHLTLISTEKEMLATTKFSETTVHFVGIHKIGEVLVINYDKWLRLCGCSFSSMNLHCLHSSIE